MTRNPQSTAVSFDVSSLHEVQQAARRYRRPFVDELALRTGLEPRQALAQMADALGWQTIETVEMLTCAPAFERFDLRRVLQTGAVLLRDADASWLAVVADPFDTDVQILLEARAGSAVTYRLALPTDIQAYVSRQESLVRTMDSVLLSGESEERTARIAEVLSFASINDAASPAIKLVNSTLYDALRAGASDIHLESTPTGLAIKYRIDGVLDPATTLSGVTLAEHVISRLKVLAELDIAERRIPQDGSFRVEVSGRDIDLRLSIMPSVHGEDAVIRILDKRAMIEAYGALTLESLGFDEESLIKLRRLAEEPYGMLLVTGPTGSGKTTTLYAAISEIHNGRDKIITIEDPVEYQLPDVLQIPVNDKKGLTFARGLRSILRHDPDKIMVGEIRDRETAEIAVQSALTGHLVLTTVHANNAFDVFGRFTHMGIDPYSFVSALNGVWAQRLIRVNCPHCARPCGVDRAELDRYGLSEDQVGRASFAAGVGCGDCRGTGYKGRKSIAEVLLLNDELRELVIEKASVRRIKEAARANGTQSLREAALALVLRGETTFDEMKRVTLDA